IDNGAENTDGVAGFLKALLLGFHETGKTRRRAWADGHGQAVAGHGGGVNPGLSILDSKVVDQKPGLEVVCSVKNEVETGEQVCGVAGAEVGDDAFHGDAGIDGAELALRGYGLGKRRDGVGCIKNGLALKSGGLYNIAIDDARV